MSHFKERTEKICLNCNTALEGRFCHVCGQENIPPKESTWHLITHFFNDITHFDGKFFSTLKLLISRPGFLSAEYARGRRAGYLDPIRMYIFTSAFFFLIFFAYIQPKQILNIKSDSAASVIQQLQEARAEIGIGLASTNDSTAIAGLQDSLRHVTNDIDLMEKDSGNIDKLTTYRYRKITSNMSRFDKISTYDSVQQTLSPEQRDGYLSKKMNHLSIKLADTYRKEGTGIANTIFEKFFHHLPQLLFVSLPLFALLLKLLYTRRKDYYYVNHIIFTLHFYIFTFITFLVLFVVSKLYYWLHWNWLGIIGSILWISIFFYLFQAMQNFYRQGITKTFFKFLLLNFLFMLVLMFLFFIFFFYTLFEV